MFAQIQIGHDLMIIDELVLDPFDGREDVEGFIDHFEPVVELAEIELQRRVVWILLEGFLIDPNNFIGLSLFEKELFQPVKNNDAPGFGIDFLENFYGVFGLAFTHQDFPDTDVGRQKRPVFLDGAAEISPCFIGVASLQQLASDFIHAASEEIGFGPSFAFSQVGFQQPMLDFERIAPFFEPDLQIAFADERDEVIRLDVEHFLQGLQGVLIPLGAFQVFRQFQQNFDVAFFNAVGLLMEADCLSEVAFDAINVSEPEQRIRLDWDR